ncbi:MAG: hypothetical protein M3082_14940 [Candidatus Dormibacteraeota bacterium]|nr:hypothetical protein [Candidatus Dormibacteraeota bacterium]
MEAEHRQDGRFSINLTTTADWFTRYQFAIRGPRPAEEILASSGLHPTALGLSSWRALNSWLGCPFFGQDGKSALQGLLVLPIYAALDPNPTVRANRIILHGRAHGRLQPDLMIAGEVLSPSGDIKGTPRPVIPAPEDPDGLNAFELAVDLDPYGFTVNESTRFQLLHKQLHALGYPASVTHNYLHAGNVDPLRQTARLFTAREWLPTYLLDQRPFKQPTSVAGFEIAVVWLLELLRIRTFPLFLSNEGEKLMSGGVEVGAADIIAFDAAFGLCLLDCTRTIPKSEKGARLREVARIVSEQLGIPVGSAIVAPVRLDMLRATWSTYGVALVDRIDLERVNDLIESGNVEVAREHLRQRLTNLPTVADS